MNNLNEIGFWKEHLGLLPIKLFGSNAHDQNDYILLNGGHGDFCLNVSPIENFDRKDLYSNSWSSNTKNFVVLNDNNVEVYNWKNKSLETISKEQVQNNFGKFHQYLIKNNYKTESDIVPFVVDIFKRFRNFTQENVGSVEALNFLFLMLATLEEDLGSLDFDSWGIQETNIPSSFDQYAIKLKSGFRDLSPSINLIMRHSAGSLFQEAHKEILFFDNQIDIWGYSSNRYEVKRNLYTSVHYTPPYLARTIVENAINSIDLEGVGALKIFDPACGSSEFLMEALKQLSELGYSGDVKIVGWDSSDVAIQTSEFLLKYEQKNNWDKRMTFELRKVSDSLNEVWDDDFDLILMNPPFVSWEQMDNSSKEAVREALSYNFYGKPNQASAFFYASTKALKPNGVIGSVIPSSILTLDAYDKLREELTEISSISVIGKLGNFIFEDAFTDVSFLICKKAQTNLLPSVIWTKNENRIADNALRDFRKLQYQNISVVNTKEYSIYKPTTFPITKQNWKIISFDENELLKKIERLASDGVLSRVIDVFNVKQGIRTGNNGVFKISKEEYDEFSTEEKVYFRPVADNDAIKDGQLYNLNYVWYPYDENGMVFSSEQEFQEMAPESFMYLERFKNDLQRRARKGIDNWWHLSEHRAWLRNKEPRLVSGEFGKSDSFAFDKEGKYAVERGNGWVPKKKFQSTNDYYYYLALFSNPFFDKLLSIYSKELGGSGEWYNLGKKYTSNIPIPNVHSEKVANSSSYEKLVSLGKDFSEGNIHSIVMIEDIIRKNIYSFH